MIFQIIKQELEWLNYWKTASITRFHAYEKYKPILKSKKRRYQAFGHCGDNKSAYMRKRHRKKRGMVVFSYWSIQLLTHSIRSVPRWVLEAPHLYRRHYVARETFYFVLVHMFFQTSTDLTRVVNLYQYETSRSTSVECIQFPDSTLMTISKYKRAHGQRSAG